jgi:two-component system OmpR family response regulator
MMSGSFSYDLYVLDLGLPDGDGNDILRQLRAAKQTAPIIITSARAQISERVSGLDCGADDYLVKPFHYSEFLARIRALLRRPARLAPTHLTVGNLVLDCANGDVSCEGQRVNLRPSERRLLSLLMRWPGRLVSRESIDNALLSIDHEVTPNAIDKAISRLRESLSRMPVGIWIRTINGLGYMLEESEHDLCPVDPRAKEPGADYGRMHPARLGRRSRVTTYDLSRRKSL